MKDHPSKVEARVVGYEKIDPNKFLSFENKELRREDFSEKRLEQFGSIGSRFISCRFEKMRVDNVLFGAGKELSEYIECSFDGLRFRSGFGGFARFVRCSFLNVDLRDWFCTSTEIIECTFSGRLRKAIFSGVVREDARSFIRREYNEFHGNDFSEMKLEDVAFRNGIDLTKQKLPKDLGYLYLPEAEAAVRRARAQVITWRDLDKRREAMVLINILEEDIRNGQEQLFLRLDDYEKSTREVDEAVFALLRGT